MSLVTYNGVVENADAYWYEVFVDLFGEGSSARHHIVYEGPNVITADKAFGIAIADHEVLWAEVRRTPRDHEPRTPPSGFDGVVGTKWLNQPKKDTIWQTLCKMDFSYRRGK